MYIRDLQVTLLAIKIEFELKERYYDVGFDIKDQDGNTVDFIIRKIFRKICKNIKRKIVKFPLHNNTLRWKNR